MQLLLCFRSPRSAKRRASYLAYSVGRVADYKQKSPFADSSVMLPDNKQGLAQCRAPCLLRVGTHQRSLTDCQQGLAQVQIASRLA